MYLDAGARRVGEFSLTDKRFSRVDRFMAHLAMQEADAHGTTVTWLAPVGDEDYPRG